MYIGVWKKLPRPSKANLKINVENLFFFLIKSWHPTYPFLPSNRSSGCIPISASHHVKLNWSYIWIPCPDLSISFENSWSILPNVYLRVLLDDKLSFSTHVESPPRSCSFLLNSIKVSVRCWLLVWYLIKSRLVHMHTFFLVILGKRRYAQQVLRKCVVNWCHLYVFSVS